MTAPRPEPARARRTAWLNRFLGPWLRQSLARRLTAAYLLTTLSVVLILGGAVYLLTTVYLDARMGSELASQADFYAAYNLVEAWAKQRCFFHLFTELIRVDKRNSSLAWQAFRKKLSRLLKDAMRLNQQRSELEEDAFKRRKQRLHQRLDALIAKPYDDDDARRLGKRLENFRGELLTFLDHEGVSSTNNHAEQQMRIPVVARKVCQQNRSEQGAKTHAVMLTLFRTAELQGHQPVEFVISLTKAAIEGHPIQLQQWDELKQAA